MKLGNVCVNNKLSHFVYVECRFFSASKYSMAKGIISSRDFSYSLTQWTQVAWLKHFFTTWSLAAVLRRESLNVEGHNTFLLVIGFKGPRQFLGSNTTEIGVPSPVTNSFQLLIYTLYWLSTNFTKTLRNIWLQQSVLHTYNISFGV